MSGKKKQAKNSGSYLIRVYYIGAGETCAMSLTCCMAYKRSEIRAMAQVKLTIIAVPVNFIDEWMTYRDWRAFVMNTYRLRFEELLETVDIIAFKKMDERLWKYLQDKRNLSDSDEIFTSHQDIAYDLNSSREVISRLLKQLERKGILKLGRNRVQMLKRG